MQDAILHGNEANRNNKAKGNVEMPWNAVAVLQPFRECGANTKDDGASGEKVRGVADSSLAGPQCRQGKG
jgi:hypothetical protein